MLVYLLQMLMRYTLKFFIFKDKLQMCFMCNSRLVGEDKEEEIGTTRVEAGEAKEVDGEVINLDKVVDLDPEDQVIGETGASMVEIKEVVEEVEAEVVDKVEDNSGKEDITVPSTSNSIPKDMLQDSMVASMLTGIITDNIHKVGIPK